MNEQLALLAKKILGLSPAERADLYAMMANTPGVSPRLLAALHELCAPNAGAGHSPTPEGGA
jgi:hypothetical protein